MPPGVPIASAWVEEALPLVGQRCPGPLISLGLEASGRLFHRISGTEPSLLLMESPAGDDSLPAFIRLSAWGREQGVPLPEVVLADLHAHRLLVQDLGPNTLHAAMAEDPAAPWGTRAFESLLRWQQAARLTPPEGAPHYDDERLSLERAIFIPWFCEALLELTPPAGLMEESAAILETPFREAPQTLVHLDWHGRNLIPQDNGTVAIVDFQDARWGPLPYDLVSFCWDAYVSWTPKDYAPWLAFYRTRAKALGLWPEGYDTAFERDFFACGLQRSLKVLGIFARLWLRDDRPTHLPYLAPVLQRLEWALGESGLAQALFAWVRQTLRPRFEAWTQAQSTASRKP